MHANDNCGYRAAASLLDFDETGWTQVRRDLLEELNNYPYLYEGVYESCERVEEIRYSLSQFDYVASYDKWIIILEGGSTTATARHYEMISNFVRKRDKEKEMQMKER